MKIALNKIELENDVHKIINIFYPNEKIDFECTDPYIEIQINEKHISIKCIPEYRISTYNTEEDSLIKSLQRALYRFLKELTGMNAPWGILVGIRPSKIALKLIKQGYSKEKVISYYEEVYLTSREKAELCYEVALAEITHINEKIDSVSVYIGMPFCPTRCAYCSFASNPIGGCSDLVLPYLYALKKEIEAISKYLSEKDLKVQCLYFGGGTPTSVNDNEFAFIMKVINDNIYSLHNIEEYTVECGRPDSITEGKLLTMKECKVSRISINPQTMNNSTLRKIGRGHNVEEVIEKFKLSRELGFDNINMDIIVGLPDEGIEEINETCSEIFKLKPESLTVHGMSLKRASRMHEEHLNMRVKNSIKVNDKIDEMYNATRELASNLDMKPYYMYRQKNMVGNMENVGYSKVEKACIYNIQMIEEKQTIIALGADAISKIVNPENGCIERFANVKDVKQYIDRIDEMIELKFNLLNKLY
jgi:coproporphyrinogen dehydrogenase HemZ